MWAHHPSQLKRRTAAKASEEGLQGSKGPLADREERAPWQKIKKVSHNISDGGVSGSHSLTGPIRFLVGPTTSRSAQYCPAAGYAPRS